MLAFDPPPLLRSRHIQSIVGSTAVRGRLIRHSVGEMLGRSETEIIDCGDGVRLLAEHSAPVQNPSGRVIVMIHGWEGSANSTYVLSAALRLWQDGDRIVRLNLRDHGDSHHLNPDIFHSCRLDEVIGAVRSIQTRFPDEKLSLAGYSLGGNFVLRVAAEAGAADIRISKGVAICPVLDPSRTMHALDSGLFIYKQYFLNKWRTSLGRKKQAFSERYDFSRLERFSNLTDMTDYFVTQYTDYPTLHDYLQGYAITGDRLASIASPCYMLMADDDPVIPIVDVERVTANRKLVVHRLPRGGHCGFVTDFRLTSFADQYVVDVLHSDGATPSA